MKRYKIIIDAEVDIKKVIKFMNSKAVGEVYDYQQEVKRR